MKIKETDVRQRHRRSESWGPEILAWNRNWLLEGLETDIEKKDNERLLLLDSFSHLFFTISIPNLYQHLLAPAVRLNKRRVLSRPGVNSFRISYQFSSTRSEESKLLPNGIPLRRGLPNGLNLKTHQQTGPSQAWMNLGKKLHQCMAVF